MTAIQEEGSGVRRARIDLRDFLFPKTDMRSADFLFPPPPSQLPITHFTEER